MNLVILEKEVKNMLMSDAIINAKTSTWRSTNSPVSVLVNFVNKELDDDQTEFDLYSQNKEQELVELWNSVYAEFTTDVRNVISVEMEDKLR